MVSRKRKQPVLHPMRRDNDGAWLCTTVADCDRPAVTQTAVTCNGCADARDEAQATLAAKRAELEHHEQQETAVLDAVKAEERDVEPVERALLVIVAEKRQQIGADLQLLAASFDQVVDEHTHPVFACDKHA